MCCFLCRKLYMAKFSTDDFQYNHVGESEFVNVMHI